MVKKKNTTLLVPSKHGLDRKYKPWRKGMSANSKNRSSLKNQLRGYERLLKKLTMKDSDADNNKDNNNDDNKNNDNHDDKKEKDVNIAQLQQKIETLKQEIAIKQQSIIEKKNAEKAHGQRFIDRQRLCRMEKQVQKSNTNDEEAEEALFKIALDQVYVAHHPMDVKYMPLFKRGQRVVEYSRILYRRAITRKRILRELHSEKRVPWIAKDQYERVQQQYQTIEWSIQDEERVFGGSIARPKSKGKNKDTMVEDDSRFAASAVATSHQTLLEAAEQAEWELERQENEDVKEREEKESDGKPSKYKKTRRLPSTHSHTNSDRNCTTDGMNDDDDDNSDSSESSDDSKSESEEDNHDDISDLFANKISSKEQHAKHEDDVDLNDSSSSSSSTSSKTNSDSDDESSSSSEGDDDDDISNIRAGSERTIEETITSAKKTMHFSTTTTPLRTTPVQLSQHHSTKEEEEEEEETKDDFLLDVNDDDDKNNIVFEPSSTQAQELPAWSSVRGNKSKGWQTQRQRPGAMMSGSYGRQRKKQQKRTWR